jgi:hypothetical protein
MTDVKPVPMGTIGLLHEEGKRVVLLLPRKNPSIAGFMERLDACRLGSVLLHRWNIPQVICRPIAFQGEPQRAPPKDRARDPQELRPAPCGPRGARLALRRPGGGTPGSVFSQSSGPVGPEGPVGGGVRHEPAPAPPAPQGRWVLRGGKVHSCPIHRREAKTPPCVNREGEPHDPTHSHRTQARSAPTCGAAKATCRHNGPPLAVNPTGASDVW